MPPKFSRSTTRDVSRRMRQDSTGAPSPAPQDRMFGISADFPQVFEVDVAACDPNPDNPRRTFDQDGLERLASSISRSGLKQPILVTKKADDRWMIVAGERRWRAHRLLGRPTIFAIRVSGEDSDETALIENLQREDLHPLERMFAFKKLMEIHGYTQSQLAEQLAVTPAVVSGTLALERLSGPVLERIEAGEGRELSGTVLAEIARAGDAMLQNVLFERACEGLTAKGLSALRRELVTVAPDTTTEAADAPAAPNPKSQGRGRPALPKATRLVTALSKNVAALGKVRGELDQDHREALRKLREEIDALL